MLLLLLLYAVACRPALQEGEREREKRSVLDERASESAPCVVADAPRSIFREREVEERVREEKKTKEKGRGNFSSCSSFSRLRDRRKQISSLSLRSLSLRSLSLLSLPVSLAATTTQSRWLCASRSPPSRDELRAGAVVAAAAAAADSPARRCFGSVAAVVRKRRRCRPRPLRLRLEQQEPLAPSQSRQKQQQQQQQRASRRRPLEVTPTEERPKRGPKLHRQKKRPRSSGPLPRPQPPRPSPRRRSRPQPPRPSPRRRSRPGTSSGP